MVSPLRFHVHAKLSFATFTMNDKSLTRRGLAPHLTEALGMGRCQKRMRSGGKDSPAFIHSTWSPSMNRRGTVQNSPPLLQDCCFTFYEIHYLLYMIRLCSCLRLSNQPPKQLTSSWNVWAFNITAEKDLLCSHKYPVEINSSTQTTRLEQFLGAFLVHRPWGNLWAMIESQSSLTKILNSSTAQCIYSCSKPINVAVSVFLGHINFLLSGDLHCSVMQCLVSPAESGCSAGGEREYACSNNYGISHSATPHFTAQSSTHSSYWWWKSNVWILFRVPEQFCWGRTC